MPVLQPVKREKPVPSTQVQKKAKAEGIVKNTVIPNGTPLIPVKKAKTEALPGESAKVLAAVKSQAIHLDGRLPATPQTGLFMNPVPLPKAPMHPPAKSPSQMTSPPQTPPITKAVHTPSPKAALPVPPQPVPAKGGAMMLGNGTMIGGLNVGAIRPTQSIQLQAAKLRTMKARPSMKLESPTTVVTPCAPAKAPSPPPPPTPPTDDVTEGFVSELERESTIRARLEKLDDAETKAKIQAVQQHPLFPKYREWLRVEVFGDDEIPEFGSGDEDEELVSWELWLTDPKHQHVPANPEHQAETAASAPPATKAVEKPVSPPPSLALSMSKPKPPVPVFTSERATPPSTPSPPPMPKAPDAKAPQAPYTPKVSNASVSGDGGASPLANQISVAAPASWSKKRGEGCEGLPILTVHGVLWYT